MKEYYNRLINRIFKALRIYEDNTDDFKRYLSSLVLELSGNLEFEQLCQVKFKLNALIINDITHDEVRKTIFECIDIVSKIIKNWGD